MAGRPPKYESEERRRRFAGLCALALVGDEQDWPFDRLARECGVKPERALRLLGERSFRDLVDTLADGLVRRAA